MKPLLLGSLLFIIGQSLIWIQSNGQFVWPWFRRNPMLVSIIFGALISYILIWATRFVVDHFDGMLWPSRFIGFAMGILTFSILTYLFMGQGINLKVLVSLLLSITLISIQLFWK